MLAEPLVEYGSGPVELRIWMHRYRGKNTRVSDSWPSVVPLFSRRATPTYAHLKFPWHAQVATRNRAPFFMTVRPAQSVLSHESGMRIPKSDGPPKYFRRLLNHQLELSSAFSVAARKKGSVRNQR